MMTSGFVTQKKIIFVSLVILTIISSLCLLFIPKAYATFPGENGALYWNERNIDDGGTSLVAKLTSEGNAQTIIERPFGPNYEVSFSPDGTKIVYLDSSEENPDAIHMDIANSDGTNRQTVTTGSISGTSIVNPVFNHDGTKIIYNEYSSGDGQGTCAINSINLNGTNKTTISSSAMVSNNHSSGDTEYYNEGYCNWKPIISPDGTKMTYLRSIVYDKGTGHNATYAKTYVYVADSNGNNATQLAELTNNNTDAYAPVLWDFIGAGCAVLDWSPNSDRILYETNPCYGAYNTTRIYTVDLQGNSTLVMEADFEDADNQGSSTLFTCDSTGVKYGYLIHASTYTPDGNILITRTDIDWNCIVDGEDIVPEADSDEDAPTKIVMINTNGVTQEELVTAESGYSDKDGLAGTYLYNPVIQPIPSEDTGGNNNGNGGNNGGNNNQDTSNKKSFKNAVDQKSAILNTPEDTTITCNSTFKEDSFDSQDTDYQYPVGFVRFCFDTTEDDNEVNLVFITDLNPDQVIPRKYYPENGTYKTIDNAEITKTTLNSKNALSVTYTITDNGELDIDPTTGKIIDPVGLGITNQTADELANTGTNILPITGLGIAIVSMAIAASVKRKTVYSLR